MKIFLFLASLVFSTSAVNAQTVGCVNGKLTNAKAWFFNHINRTEGSPANDWNAVFRSSGLLAGPPAGVKAGSANYGITQQFDSAGNPRSRIFLPTDIPDANNYYTRQTDTVRGTASNQFWTWNEFTADPPYAPRDCDSVIIVPPPDSDLTERVTILEVQVKQLQDSFTALDNLVNQMNINLQEQGKLVQVLIARPYYTKCQAGRVLGMRPSCELFQ